MKTTIGFVLIVTVLMSCGESSENSVKKPSVPLVGTWQLVTAMIIEKGDTLVTDYTKKISFIKIINDTHFSFLQHDLSKGKDSASAVFGAGGGTYSLQDSSYTEHLEYCNAREWEGNDFKLTVSIQNDTLIQRGVEKVESAGVDRVNIEKYARVK
ncbi:hypothetical protein [Segetibacter aerophilus]|uniref:Lipocalin-like domain-containing protein n=1 Tax=Segetibacter aerophilus TaxID=670293 RepID=A0A512BD19_9BACT|nr:hypothetical protein [Segetibacter aerophilus]GEO09785.1 hypothetical protein SAE01_22810 [Segetibacter aerophilus]